MPTTTRRVLLICGGVLLGLGIVISVPAGWFFVRVLAPSRKVAATLHEAAEIRESLPTATSRSPETSPFQIQRVRSVLDGLKSDLESTRRVLSEADRAVESSRLSGMSLSIKLQSALAELAVDHAKGLRAVGMSPVEFYHHARSIHAGLRDLAAAGSNIGTGWREVHREDRSPSDGSKLSGILGATRSYDRFEEFAPEPAEGRSIRATLEQSGSLDWNATFVQLLDLTPVLELLGETEPEATNRNP